MADKKKTILVVDDEDSIRKLHRAVLGLNYDVLEAKDGEEGLATIARSQTNGQKVALVVTDLNMPNMNGICLSRNLIEQHRLPVIMSASLGNQEQIDALEQLVNLYMLQGVYFAFFPKPVAPAILLKSVKVGLSYSPK